MPMAPFTELCEICPPVAARFRVHELAGSHLALVRQLLQAYIRWHGSCSPYAEQLAAYAKLEEVLRREETQATDRPPALHNIALEVALCRARSASRAGVSLGRLLAAVPLYVVDRPPAPRR